MQVSPLHLEREGTIDRTYIMLAVKAFCERADAAREVDVGGESTARARLRRRRLPFMLLALGVNVCSTLDPSSKESFLWPAREVALPGGSDEVLWTSWSATVARSPSIPLTRRVLMLINC